MKSTGANEGFSCSARLQSCFCRYSARIHTVLYLCLCGGVLTHLLHFGQGSDLTPTWPVEQLLNDSQMHASGLLQLRLSSTPWAGACAVVLRGLGKMSEGSRHGPAAGLSILGPAVGSSSIVDSLFAPPYSVLIRTNVCVVFRTTRSRSPRHLRLARLSWPRGRFLTNDSFKETLELLCLGNCHISSLMR